ncbi:carbohydrate-binding module family 32 [Trichoderma arundinaceum]|uniref:alpha,alpha-trehalase n=1 Tax=Trichoderma arundinaceum TaxID=490622 RepID=A0A395P080_TRIAR|nr:carbohydrate-binding module family 32 [Trichoderma arundinaceum]
MAFLLGPVVIALWGACSYGLPLSDSDPWILSTNQFIANFYQSTPYVANGYFGQRLPAEGVGYWIYQDNSTGGYMLNLTTEDGQTYAPGVESSTIKDFHQSFSIRNGIVQTNITWNPFGDRATYQLNYTVIAHRARLNLGIVRLDLAADQNVRLKITDILDGAGAVRAEFNDKSFEEDATIWTSVNPSGIGYCTAYVVSTVKFETTGNAGLDDMQHESRTRHNGGGYPWVSINSSTIAQTWDWGLRRGDTLTVYKFVGIGSTAAFPANTLSVVKDVAMLARSAAWDTLISEHTEKWDAIWDDADIIIPDNRDLQTRTRASLFHILTNLLPEDTGFANNSISVGGLSSDSYAGLIFWDSDTWIFPSVLSLHPQYAAGINNYRGLRLNQAVENARYYNFSGALYPWTSGRYGNCTGTGPCFGYQYHINADIALAHWQYFQQTNDLTWLAKKGWPLIREVANMFASYVFHNNSTGQYETIQMGEPDEFAYNINNGAFSNIAIKQLLGNWAPSAANRLNLEIPKNWSHIAQNMYIPYNEKEKIVVEFSGMDGLWRLSDTQARNDVAYYSSVNTADGPAMTWSIYAISEAQLQQKGCSSYTFLQKSSEPYIRQPFYQFSETQLDSEPEGVNNPAFIFGLNPAFPFLTGAGGYLQIFTHGLTGMRPNLDVLYLDPMLPPQLPKGVQIRGMKWRNASFDVTIELTNTTITRRVNTPSRMKKQVPLRILGGDLEVQEYLLAEGDSIVVPTRRPDISQSPADLALCRPVISDTDWAAGNYPYAAVDGSNSTVWQPASPQKASVIIDLGKIQGIAKIVINWGNVPPSDFSLLGGKKMENAFEELSPTQKVKVSAPYDPETAHIIQIREGNETAVKFNKLAQLRFLKLVIEGSYSANGLGATVAEVQIIGVKDYSDYYGTNMRKRFSFVVNSLWRSMRSNVSWIV